ncbi:hypothetical protein Barb6_02247 [Bacteroidales bacterium Barb6]|nr:hypothetical protein Barb6_02247 [Bacteroidales bacterium Barb6]
MVKKIFILTMTLFSICATAQIRDTTEELIITYIGDPPVFKGDLKDYIKNNINYPQNALIDSIEGTVYVYFNIDETGLTKDHKILRGIRCDLDNEALRICEQITFEKPAMQKCKPIIVPFTVPVIFRMKDD